MNEVESTKIWMANLLMDDPGFPDVLFQGSMKRVYTDHAEISQGFPYVLINLMSGIDRPGLGTVRIQTEAIYMVRVVEENAPSDDSRAIEGWFDDLLQHQVAQPAGDYVVTCRRIAPFSRAEYDASKARFFHSGGQYKVWCYKT